MYKYVEISKQEFSMEKENTLRRKKYDFGCFNI